MSIGKIYENYSKTRFPLPNVSAIDAFEERNSITLPDAYRKFILEYNGGSFRSTVVSFGDGNSDFLTFMHGIGATFPGAELEEDVGLLDDDSLLIIGGTGMGSLLLLDIEKGQILIKQSFDHSIEILADCLEEFFDGLTIDET